MITRLFGLPQGRVRPSRIAVGARTVLRARGIPVARAERRFLPPVPDVGWAGIRVDDPHPAVSPQHRAAFVFDAPGEVIGDGRSCIHASVWAPQGAERLPVLVWLHGGGGFAGSSTERDATLLAARLDAVVVALSFRVGAMGHLHLGEHFGGEYADSANAGLHDVRIGLQWVQRNASFLGGSGSRVVLGGQSAGAAMVATVLATEWGTKLVSRAIMQSGSAERFHTVAQAEAIADSMSTLVGGSQRLLSLPESEIVGAQGRLLHQSLRGALELPTPFRPVAGTASLSRSPLQSFEGGLAGDTPLLIGTNIREAAAVARVFPAARHEMKKSGERYREALEFARASGLDVGDDTVAWCTDRAYRQPTERVLSARLSASAPTYAYLFTGTRGAEPVHNAELDLLFYPQVGRRGVGLVDLWRDFVHGDNATLGGMWHPIGRDRGVAIIGDEIRMSSDPLGMLRERYSD